MKPVIGILGCSGAVGREACGILLEKYFVKGGQRSRCETVRNDNFLGWHTVDVFDPDALDEFCDGCDVVLNCAGPSYRVKALAAVASDRAGADYVDVFGADPLADYLTKNASRLNAAFVISAGVFPGLSGLFPRWLKHRAFDRVSHVHAFGGGKELLSKIGGADFLLSALKGFGAPDVYWENGDRATYGEPFPKTARLSGFGEVLVQPFLHTEYARLGDKLGLSEAHWYNIFVDPLIHEAVRSAILNVSSRAGFDGLEQAAADMAGISASLFAGQPQWYRMMIDMAGEKNGEPVQKRSILTGKSGYQLSAVVAACAVDMLVERQLENGVFWAFDCLDPQVVFDRLVDTGAAALPEIFDIRRPAYELFAPAVVEGQL